MRQSLNRVITHVRRLEIEDVNHHVIALGYVMTALLFDGHSTLVMTAVYLWSGLVHQRSLRAAHSHIHLPRLRRPVPDRATA